MHREPSSKKLHCKSIEFLLQAANMEKETKNKNFFWFLLLLPAALLAKQMVQEIRLVLPFFFPPQHTK